MGTYTIGYNDGSNGIGYININLSPSISVSASSFKPTITFSGSIRGNAPLVDATDPRYYSLGTFYLDGSPISYVYPNSSKVANSSTWAAFNSTQTHQYSLYTSTYFNSNNKTTNYVNLPITIANVVGNADDYGSFYLHNRTGVYTTIGSLKVVLNAPPTFSETFSYTGDFSGVPYAGLTTANVTLSSLSAKYGGDFSGVGKAEFTIGSVTATKANPANNDELSIALNAVGTFTPTVKVTDSRGQVTTHTLPAITVMGYTAPSVTFDTERTLSTGAPNDEGTYAVIDTKYTFTDAIATLSAPTVAVTDAEGVARTPTVTWYSTRAADGTLSGSVTWSNLSSGDSVYGLVSITNGFNTQKSYQISLTPQDSEGSGTTITQTLGSAFYTVDFLAGGHGIAFGQPASEEGFECNMSALFKDDLLLDLPEYTTSDTTDKAIYDAVVALGWDSDVLVN